jgi:hypothetical protein
MNHGELSLKKITIVRICAVILTTLISSLVAAEDLDIIDEALVKETAEGYEIGIRFNATMQLLGYTPEVRGSRLYVDVHHTNPSAGVNDVSKQLLNIDSGKESPVKFISYQEEKGYGKLEIILKAVEEFTVVSSPDMRKIVIALKSAEPKFSATTEQEELAKSLMKEARRALIDTRDFPAALVLYQRVLGLPSNKYSQDALEYLGLVRERMGDRDEAIRVYDHYLSQYPEGLGTDRVNQRRISLVSATAAAQKKRRTVTLADKPPDWETYGSISEYYYRNNYTVDGKTDVTASLLMTDGDIVARHRTTISETRIRMSGGYAHDFLDDGSNDRTTHISSAYAEYKDEYHGISGRLGRQSSRRDGVLSRFDGVRAEYELASNAQVAFVAGYPVSSSYDGIETDQTFTGLSLNIGPYLDAWEFTLYGLNQTTGNLVDRQAVGVETRYFRPELSIVSLLDYDVFYEEMNIANVLAIWNISSDTTFNATADFRKLPILTTQNALQGQITPDFKAIETTDELQKYFSDKEIYQLARDRTPDSRSITIGGSHTFTPTLRLSSDLNIFSISSSMESGGVAAQPSSGNQYFFNTQLTGTGLIGKDDITHLGGRWSHTQSSSAWGFYAGSRYPLNEHWRIYPRMGVDHVRWTLIDKRQWRYTPKLRVEYRKSRFQVDFELSGEWNNSQLADDSEKSWGLFSVLGIRYEF